MSTPKEHSAPMPAASDATVKTAQGTISERQARQLLRLLLTELPDLPEVSIELPTLDRLTSEPEPLRPLFPVKYWYTHRAEPMLPPAALALTAGWPPLLRRFVLLEDRRLHTTELITDLELYVNYLLAVAHPSGLWTAHLQRDLVHRLYAEEWPGEIFADAFADAWRNMAEAHLLRGELETAAACFERALTPTLQLDLSARAAGEGYLSRALLFLLRGSPAASATDLDCARDLFVRGDLPFLEAAALVRLAFVELERGRHQRARQWAEEALELYRETPPEDDPVACQAEWVLDHVAAGGRGDAPFAPGPLSVSFFAD